LEEWGYSVGLSVDGSNNYTTKQVEYRNLERMGLSDLEGETHSDVDHGRGSSSGSTALVEIVRSSLTGFPEECDPFILGIVARENLLD
jgi:hypothetical protein